MSRFYLYKGNLSQVKIPAVQKNENLVAPDIQKIVQCIDWIVKKLIWRSRHACFYRSFSRAVVLRRMGLPVVFNVGLRNLDGKCPVRGHCWLTLEDALFHEPESTTKIYPIFLDTLQNGIVCWMQNGNDQANGILRVHA